MFCPKCGLEDKQDNQFCRSCGADLNRVRSSVLLPDTGGDPRSEVSRIIAAKIGYIESAEELKTVAEDVLPELEKFLESPAQRRLRRMRIGMLLSCIGIGTAISCLIIAFATNDPKVLAGCGGGLIVFFIGLAFILNGVYLTVPRGALGSPMDASSERQAGLPESPATDFRIPAAPESAHFSSITEGTTRHLDQVRAAETEETGSL